MAVFDGQLWVGVANYATGAEVWRSSDGLVWSQSNVDGFGSADNQDVGAMATAGGYLWATTFIWSTHDGLSWTQLSFPSFGVSGNWSTGTLAVMGGYVYAGANNTAGCQVWRSGELIFADSFESGTHSSWSNTTK